MRSAEHFCHRVVDYGGLVVRSWKEEDALELLCLPVLCASNVHRHRAGFTRQQVDVRVATIFVLVIVVGAALHGNPKDAFPAIDLATQEALQVILAFMDGLGPGIVRQIGSPLAVNEVVGAAILVVLVVSVHQRRVDGPVVIRRIVVVGTFILAALVAAVNHAALAAQVEGAETVRPTQPRLGVLHHDLPTGLAVIVVQRMHRVDPMSDIAQIAFGWTLLLLQGADRTFLVHRLKALSDRLACPAHEVGVVVAVGHSVAAVVYGNPAHLAMVQLAALLAVAVPANIAA
mmetsp:Transcript_19689/g.55627  ORF Transcript_19689/g.55627 Transcript_19689/m.55627 type:complete len:288 (-) Transcript_19689:164-1027(-)